MSELYLSLAGREEKKVDGNAHSKIREMNKLRLRKEKLNDYLMSSHLGDIQSIVMNSSEYEIKADQLQLSAKFISEYTASSTQLLFALNNLSAGDLKMQKFSLWQLHEQFKRSVPVTIDHLILPSTITDLMSLLYSYGLKDKSILYEITWLFIQFTAHSKSLSYQIATENLIKMLFSVLTSTSIDFCLMNNIIVLFTYWLSDKQLFDFITKSCNIAGFIFRSIQVSDKTNFPMPFLANCFRMLCNLLNASSFPLLKGFISDHIKHIVKYVISDLNQEVFKTALNVLRKIFSYCEEGDISSDLIEEIGLISIIVQQLRPDVTDEDVLSNCLAILIDLTYVDCSYVSLILFNTDTVAKLQALLEQMTQSGSEHKGLLSSVTDLLRNCMGLNSTVEYLVRRTLVFKHLVALLQLDLSKEEYKGVMMLLEDVLLTSNKALFLEAIYLEFPRRVVFATLNSNRDEESKMMSLSIANALLAFAEDLVKGQNFIKRHYDTIGLSSLIESYGNCNNKALSDKAEEMSKYFQ